MCHLVFRAGELVGGNMSCYCSITGCTKRQCKGMYVCVLGIPKGKFSKQMKEKKLSYRIIRIKRIFSGVY